MDSLRISLIIIGAVVLLLLYLGMRFFQGRSSDKSESAAPRSEPSFAEQLDRAQQDEWEVIPVKRTDESKAEQHNPEAEQNEPAIHTEPLSETPIATTEPAVQAEPVTEPPLEQEPVIEAAPVDETVSVDETAAPADEPAKPTQPQPEPAVANIPEVIALHIMAKEGDFKGVDLVKAANLAAMRFGEMEIFHFQGHTEGDTTFAMANMLEPGTFDMDKLESFTTPGVLLFMESKYQAEIANSVESMARVAQRLCEVLDGQLSNDRRQPMEVAQLEAWKAHLLGH